MDSIKDLKSVIIYAIKISTHRTELLSKVFELQRLFFYGCTYLSKIKKHYSFYINFRLLMFHRDDKSSLTLKQIAKKKTKGKITFMFIPR